MPYTRSGIVAYAAYPGDNDGILCTRVLTDGYPLRGTDHFLNLSTLFSHWPAEYVSPEIEFDADTRVIVRRIRVRTFSEEDKIGADLVASVKGVYDADWRYEFPSAGTIACSTSAVTGTGTAWSHVIAIGDNSEDTFTLPVEASRCSIYLDSVLTTAYTSSEDSITFTAAPGTGVTVTAFWEGSPEVTMRVGHFIKTAEGWHRVTAVNTATSIDLEWYPTSGTGVVGEHIPAYRILPGERETVVPVNQLCDRPQFRILLLPRNHPTSARVAKLLSFIVEYDLVGQKQAEEDEA